ncbi:MAG: NINE protein [Persicimonas sp.]
MKSKGTAALLAFFLGGLGIHKFYLNQGGQGVLYLLFSWTLIPAFVALLETFVYLTMDDATFQQKYGSQPRLPAHSGQGGAGSQNAQNITLNMPAQGGPQASVSDELEKLGKLRSSGVLTEEEFRVQKQKLLQ